MPIAPFYDQVFLRRVYASPTPLPEKPRIIDAGGHLGLASLYFLTNYPGCRLTVIEANPNLAELLRSNLAPWANLANVVEAALSTENGTIPFYVKRDDPIAVTGAIENRERPEFAVSTYLVRSVDARALLTEPVDLLKLDVEGHEYKLLQLPQFEPATVRNLVVEFHDVDRHADEFRAICRTLVQDRGYRVANTENVALSLSRVVELKECPVLKLF